MVVQLTDNSLTAYNKPFYVITFLLSDNQLCLLTVGVCPSILRSQFTGEYDHLCGPSPASTSFTFSSLSAISLTADLLLAALLM